MLISFSLCATLSPPQSRTIRAYIRSAVLEDRRYRFQNMISEGADFYLLFAGKCTPPSIVQWIKKKLPEFGFEFDENCLITVATTDSDPTRMAVAQNFIDPATGENFIQRSFTSMQAHLSKGGYRMYDTCKHN